MGLIVHERAPFFLLRRVGAVQASDFEASLELLRQRLVATEKPLITVYDTGRDSEGSPDAQTRRACAAWMHEHEGLLRKKLESFEFVSKSPLSRGVLTAIFWVRNPPFTTHFHENVRVALESAGSRSGSKQQADALLREVEAAT